MVFLYHHFAGFLFLKVLLQEMGEYEYSLYLILQRRLEIFALDSPSVPQPGCRFQSHAQVGKLGKEKMVGESKQGQWEEEAYLVALW